MVKIASMNVIDLLLLDGQVYKMTSRRELQKDVNAYEHQRHEHLYVNMCDVVDDK